MWLTLVKSSSSIFSSPSLEFSLNNSSHGGQICMVALSTLGGTNCDAQAMQLTLSLNSAHFEGITDPGLRDIFIWVIMNTDDKVLN